MFEVNGEISAGDEVVGRLGKLPEGISAVEVQALTQGGLDARGARVQIEPCVEEVGRHRPQGCMGVGCDLGAEDGAATAIDTAEVEFLDIEIKEAQGEGIELRAVGTAHGEDAGRRAGAEKLGEGDGAQVGKDRRVAEEAGDTDEEGVKGEVECGGIVFDAADGIDRGTGMQGAEAGRDAPGEGARTVGTGMKTGALENEVEQETIGG